MGEVVDGRVGDAREGSGKWPLLSRPSSGPLLYQPDLLLLKCAKNSLGYRAQRLSSQKGSLARSQSR
jgi:hypothetical protein